MQRSDPITATTPRKLVSVVTTDEMSDNSSEITNYGEALAFIEAQGCNVTCDSNNTNPDDRPTEANVVTLQFLTHEIGKMRIWHD